VVATTVQRLLLPPTAVPVRLVLADQQDLPNTAAAQSFPDAAAAERAMGAAGRVAGATVAYRLLSATPRPDEPATAVAASVAVYRTAAAAAAVLRDPTLPLALDALGVPGTEAGAAGDPVGDGSRVFQGHRAGDGDTLATTVVVFRQGNTLGTITVVAPTQTLSRARTELALLLARRQAALPIPLTLTPTYLTT
jgi:hypothetical protein